MTKTALSYKDWLSGLVAGDHVIINDTRPRFVTHSLATVNEVAASKIVVSLPNGNPLSFSRASGRSPVGGVSLREAIEEVRAQTEDMRAMGKACDAWLETNQRSDALSPQSLKILHEAIQAIEAIEAEA